MERILSTEVVGRVGETVTVAGWLHAVRRPGGIVFAVLRDRGGLIQVVSENPRDGDLLQELGVESVLAVSGRVVREERAPLGVEIRAERIVPIAPVSTELPLQINKRSLTAGLEVLLDHRAISLRSPQVRAIFRAQHEVAMSFAEFLAAQGFTNIHTPKLVSAGAEGGSDIFSVDYFGERAYLGQSPQFYKQMMVSVCERVFEIAPAYRAEKHDTTRHTNEFTMLDLEMGFIERYEDVMAMENAWLCHLAERLRERCAEEFRLLEAGIPHVPERIPRVRLAAVQEAIGRCLGEPDLDPEGERLACQWASGAVRQRAPLHHALRHREAPLLRDGRSRGPATDLELRPTLPRLGDNDGRPAAAPIRGLRGQNDSSRSGPGGFRLLPGGLPLWHAAARRIRRRARAPHRTAAEPRQHPGGHSLSEGPQAASALRPGYD